MKNINILSLVQAQSTLQEDSYKNFLSHYGIKIKNEEVNDLALLIKVLSNQTSNKSIFNQYYLGYQIPQIGKEFDLLRFGKECIINIELKKTSTPEKIEKQLKLNKYYLSFIGKKIHHFCFQSDTLELFYLSDIGELENVDFSSLIKLLEGQQPDNITNIDSLFNPSDYLVSPFNSTEKFIKDEYFLTKHQETIKNEILKTIEDKTTAKFISTTGSAGTGKTLLTYDIAKELKQAGKKVLIIHCGYLNNGQIKLKTDYGWNIIPIKQYSLRDLADYDVVIIDETQRIYPKQLEDIVNKTQINNGKCIFSYDKSQTLAKWEESNNIDELINNIDSIISYELSEKIRTNKEIASFIKALFNKKRNINLSRSDNIQLNYFGGVDDAKDYLGSLNNKEWEILRFTPSQYHKEHHENYSDTSNETPHGVIGQEFEGVVVTIDTLFSYNENGDLIYKGITYYDSTKMLFQNITRTRKRLNIVIINNRELLDRCISILQTNLV
jgi:Cdc6-like AAA superfamily ATPase